ncbi:MAG: protein translocase subunit SecD [Candidatus Omnitrophota bacterium]
MYGNLKWKALLIVAVIGLAIWAAFPLGEKINLGLDLQGGMHLVLLVDTSKLPPDAKADAADRAVEIIRNRIDEFGVREPSIHRQGQDRVVVQLPGITDRDRAIELIGRTAQLEFKLVSDDPQKLKDAIAGNIPEGYELKYVKDESEQLLVEKQASLSGDSLTTALIKFDESHFGEPIVALTFNAKGAKKFAQITGDNIGKRLAIVLDGVVYSAPQIRERIPGGQAVITGRFTQEEAGDLAIVLRAGALPAPISIEEERTVGPTLGRDSIKDGFRAAVIGTLIVFVFMAIYYMLSGIVADFARALNLLLLMAAMAILGASLTLPGIAGIALTLGMAVDANVLINERIREEIKFGKHIRSAIVAGYKRAFLTIFDANLTTFITAIILFWFGTGPVRGFATTLSIGLIISMFTAVFVTRVIMDTITAKKGFNKLPMLQFFKETHVNFVKVRKTCYIISIIFIAIGIAAFTMRGKKNFGIEFTGGTLQQFEFAKPVSPDAIREALNEIGLGGSSIQELKPQRDFLIRSYDDTSKQIIEKFRQTFTDNKFELCRLEKIGPVVGKEITQRAIWAIILALIAICIYVGFRFEFKWALAADIALLHDMLVCLGALALTKREISIPVLAALLTMIGYSINDTIVIFDRIRENLKLMRKADLATIINMSVNQTLSRTILTSVCTMFIVAALYFFGGTVINDFSFVFLVGIITGSYSTIYVAAPLILDWPGRKR